MTKKVSKKANEKIMKSTKMDDVKIWLSGVSFYRDLPDLAYLVKEISVNCSTELKSISLLIEDDKHGDIHIDEKNVLEIGKHIFIKIEWKDGWNKENNENFKHITEKEQFIRNYADAWIKSMLYQKKGKK